MRYEVLILLGVLFLVGCTQQVEELTCEEYCVDQPHIQCVGEWNISGVYPDCNCEWVCSDVVVVNDTNGETCTTNWTCTDWSECSNNGLQTRTCVDVNDCNTTEGKPVENQSCTFENICDQVKDESLNAECNVLYLRDPSYCLEDSFEGCVSDLAKITLNHSLCELINTSLARNSCHAALDIDDSYCDRLEPSIRDLCLTTIDAFLKNRATIENDSYYCQFINNTAIKTNCDRTYNDNNYYNHLGNVSVCERFDFDDNSTTYQEIFSCYVYHVKNDAVNPCEAIENVYNLTTFLYDECEALWDRDLSYCYDFNGSRRDRCFAHFAYVMNDPLICRDAYNRNECLNIWGKYFGNSDRCREISSESLRNSCVYSVATQCLTRSFKSCNKSDCKTVINNDGLKDVCIYNVIDYEAKHSFILKESI